MAPGTDKAASLGTEARLLQQLRTRLENPGYIFIEQVRERTGLNAGRAMDALGISIYPSRGIFLAGFEAKCSRSDWQSELAQPEKSAGFIQYCRHWWLVCANTGIAEEHEIPAAWGWIEWNGRRLVTRRPAPTLKSVPPPIDFVAAILRRAMSRMTPSGSVADLVDQAFKRGVASVRNGVDRRLQDAQRELEELRATLQGVEEAIGGRLYGRNMERLFKDIKVARQLQDFCHPATAGAARQIGNDAIALAAALEAIANAVGLEEGVGA